MLSNWRTQLVYITFYIQVQFILLWRNSPTGAHAASFLRVHDHRLTHNIRQDPSGRAISTSQRPLPNITHNTQEKYIHAADGIRTRNPSKRAAEDPRFRQRGHRDRPSSTITSRKSHKLRHWIHSLELNVATSCLGKRTLQQDACDNRTVECRQPIE
jgi:hypothetical protein